MKIMGFVVAALSLILPTHSWAQRAYAIDRGSMLIEGSAGFSSRGGDLYDGQGSDRTNVLTINPTVAYFAAPHFTLGGAVDFSKTSGGFSDTSIGFGPIMGYFFGGPNSRIFPFLTTSYLFQDHQASFKANKVRFNGGAAFMIAKNIALTGEAYYSIENFKFDRAVIFGDAVNGNIFGIEFGIAAFVF